MARASRNYNNYLFVIIGILFVSLLASIYYIFSLKADIASNKRIFEKEKIAKVKELENLQEEYEEFLVENEINKKEIAEAKIRLKTLLDSVKNLKADYNLLAKLRNVRDHLTLKLKKLEEENIALKERNSILVDENIKVENQYQSTLVVYKEAQQKNEDLNKIINKAQKLTITNVENKALRLKKSGKVVSSSTSRKTTSIEVCYEVPENVVTEAGSKEFYIQLLSPDNVVIGGNFVIENELGEQIKISKVSKFRYQNKVTRVCDYLEPVGEETFQEGTYTVNIFEETNLISTSEIVLK